MDEAGREVLWCFPPNSRLRPCRIVPDFFLDLDRVRRGGKTWIREEDESVTLAESVGRVGRSWEKDNRSSRQQCTHETTEADKRLTLGSIGLVVLRRKSALSASSKD